MSIPYIEIVYLLQLIFHYSAIIIHNGSDVIKSSKCLPPYIEKLIITRSQKMQVK